MINDCVGMQLPSKLQMMQPFHDLVSENGPICLFALVYKYSMFNVPHAIVLCAESHDSHVIYGSHAHMVNLVYIVM